MPTRLAQAQADRDTALHLLKKAAAADAELELAETFEQARSEAAMIRASAERLVELADDIERACASRVFTLLGQAEHTAPGPLATLPSASRGPDAGARA